MLFVLRLIMFSFSTFFYCLPLFAVTLSGTSFIKDESRLQCLTAMQKFTPQDGVSVGDSAVSGVFQEPNDAEDKSQSVVVHRRQLTKENMNRKYSANERAVGGRKTRRFSGSFKLENTNISRQRRGESNKAEREGVDSVQFGKAKPNEVLLVDDDSNQNNVDRKRRQEIKTSGSSMNSMTNSDSPKLSQEPHKLESGENEQINEVAVMGKRDDTSNQKNPTNSAVATKDLRERRNEESKTAKNEEMEYDDEYYDDDDASLSNDNTRITSSEMKRNIDDHEPSYVNGVENELEMEDGEGNGSKKVWDAWGTWSQCSVTCGTGKSAIWRHCIDGACQPGEKEARVKICNIQPCKR